MRRKRSKPHHASSEHTSQAVASKNKFYGKTLDRSADQWLYLERYLNTLNAYVVRGLIMQGASHGWSEAQMKTDFAMGSIERGSDDNLMMTPDVPKGMSEFSGPYSYH